MAGPTLSASGWFVPALAAEPDDGPYAALRHAEAQRDALAQQLAAARDALARARGERDEAVGAVRDLVDNYAALDEQAFAAAHARALRVIGGGA